LLCLDIVAGPVESLIERSLSGNGEGGKPKFAKPEINVAVRCRTVDQMIRIMQAGIISQKSRLGIETVIIGEFITFLALSDAVGKGIYRRWLGWGLAGAAGRLPGRSSFGHHI